MEAATPLFTNVLQFWVENCRLFSFFVLFVIW
jgi:hypothetical protein